MSGAKEVRFVVWVAAWLAALPLALGAVFAISGAAICALRHLPLIGHECYAEAGGILLGTVLLSWALMVLTRWGAWLWTVGWCLLGAWLFVDTIAAVSMRVSGDLGGATLAARAPWGSGLLGAALFVAICVLQLWVAAEARIRVATRSAHVSAAAYKWSVRGIVVVMGLLLAVWLAAGPGLAIYFGLWTCIICALAAAATLSPHANVRLLPPKRGRAAVIVPIAMVLVLAVGLVLGWGPPMPFDANKWRGPGPPTRHRYERFSWGDNSRVRMLDDLLSTHLHLGMTAQETQRLLGRYDHTGYWSCFELLPCPTLSQTLLACGRWGWFGPNLQLKFAEHDHRPVSLIETRVIKYFD